MQVSLFAQKEEQPQRRASQQKGHQVISRQLDDLALKTAKAKGQADQQVAYRKLTHHPRQRRQVQRGNGNARSAQGRERHPPPLKLQPQCHRRQVQDEYVHQGIIQQQCFYIRHHT